ncbi:hypothetical protein TNCV_3987231 [Trichonephila clavipes]|nr:hypothetical protein TNCV_3987231 [Trichonephila clavipes]
MPTGSAPRERRRRNQRLETLLPGRQESPVQSGGSYSLGCVVGLKLVGEKEKVEDEIRGGRAGLPIGRSARLLLEDRVSRKELVGKFI